MYIEKWFKVRGARFVWQRATTLLQRHYITTTKAIHQIEECAEMLVEMGCPPTFFVPGIIVKRYPKFIQYLQQIGAEIGVHGYYHLNLALLTVTAANQQLIQAIQTFEHCGIENRGFRCPYLGYSNELLVSLPDGMFDYSSNEAVHWNVLDSNDLHLKDLFYSALEKFYKAKESSETLSLPKIQSKMVEIPICVPDDLQLHDGLSLNDQGIIQAWTRFLEQTYIRGELFTLIFHTELASYNLTSFVELIRRAKQYQPVVWITRLREICDWWREKSKFGVNITNNLQALKLTFSCSPRATILIRGLDAHGSASIWDDKYSRLNSDTLEVQTNPRPFIGIPDGIPKQVVSFLLDQGYILDTGETARFCGLILNIDLLSTLPNNVALVNYIESSQAPLVRYWRWPNGAKSALSITGDLDALSLIDYVIRLFAS